MPKFNQNLLYIHRLAQEIDCQMIFLLDKCMIMSSQIKKMKGIRRLKNRLYYIQNKATEVINSFANEVAAQLHKEEYDVWHNRLGTRFGSSKS